MRTTKVERVRGLNDILPDTCTTSKQIEDKLRQCFESFGYRPIEVPLIEYTELYLKKSGEDIVARLYDFIYRNRRLCLRPEMTASVIRAYVDNLQDRPLPVRVSYAGAAFRYERPQKGRYRQFTQMGIELIGVTGVMADAEVIAVACQGLDQLNLTGYRVVIGHIGVLTKFLDNLQLDNRLRSFLLANMEVLRKEGKSEVERRLKEIYPAFGAQQVAPTELESDETETTGRLKRLTSIFQGMEETEARVAILDLLKSMNIDLNGTRNPEEIVDRLLAKMKRQDQTEQVSQALEFMTQLGQLVGEPTQVLQSAEKLLSTYGIDHAGLEQLHEIVNTLKFYNLDQNRISLDLGLSRGLQYYTGMVFEIHHGTLDDQRQICGGGRYDDLVNTFGGRKDTPATGFSYGLERLRLALEAEGKINQTHQSVDILVVPVSVEDCGYAIGVADQIRQQGLRVEIDVRNRNISSNFQYADRREIPFVILVGKEEKLASEVTLKNMASGEQQRIPVSEVANQINQISQ